MFQHFPAYRKGMHLRVSCVTNLCSLHIKRKQYLTGNPNVTCLRNAEWYPNDARDIVAIYLHNVKFIHIEYEASTRIQNPCIVSGRERKMFGKRPNCVCSRSTERPKHAEIERFAYLNSCWLVAARRTNLSSDEKRPSADGQYCCPHCCGAACWSLWWIRPMRRKQICIERSQDALEAAVVVLAVDWPTWWARADSGGRWSWGRARRNRCGMHNCWCSGSDWSSSGGADAAPAEAAGTEWALAAAGSSWAYLTKAWSKDKSIPRHWLTNSTGSYCCCYCCTATDKSSSSCNSSSYSYTYTVTIAVRAAVTGSH